MDRITEHEVQNLCLAALTDVSQIDIDLVVLSKLHRQLKSIVAVDNKNGWVFELTDVDPEQERQIRNPRSKEFGLPSYTNSCRICSGNSKCTEN